MLNQSVIVGRVLNINPYNQGQWVSFDIHWSEDHRAIPLYITSNRLADSFMKLVEEGSLVGIKGVLEHTYLDRFQKFGIDFKVTSFSLL